MNASLKPLGHPKPSELFHQMYREGSKDLLSIEQFIQSENTDNPVERPRTWGLKEAADLIGRSATWLSKADPDAPTNSRGHYRWDLKRINELREKTGTRYHRPEGSKPIKAPVYNVKGGVGKSTGCSNLAVNFVISGLRVLVIDLDPQGTTSYLLSDLVPDIRLEEEDIITNTLVEDFNFIKNVVRPTRYDGLDLIPNNAKFQGIDVLLANPEINNEKALGPAALRLRRALSLIEDNYDIILFDCPPAISAVTANALLAANALIISQPPRAMDRAAFVQLAGGISDFMEQIGDPEFEYIRIMINLHDNSSIQKTQESKLREFYGDWVMNNVLIKSADIEKASILGSTIYDFEKPLNKKETYQRGLESINAVAQEMINDFKQIWENNNG